MNIGNTTKQPSEKLSYTADYSLALTAGDNVQSATVSASPAGLTIDNVAVYDPRVKFWASGGTDGEVYKITLTVSTTDGRVFQDEIYMSVEEI